MTKEIEKESKGLKAFWEKHKHQVVNFGKGVAVGGGLLATFLVGTMVGDVFDKSEEEEEFEEEEMNEVEENDVEETDED